MTIHSKKTMFLLGMAIVVLLGSCAQPFDFNNDNPVDDSPAEDDPVALTIEADSFTVAWDSVSGDVTGYKVFYRPHGGNVWTELGQVDGADATTFEVSSSDLDHGTYDFAVSAVIEGGDTTDYHTSLDTTADPETGWYLEWKSG